MTTATVAPDWAHCHTLADLGHATAAWLEGHLTEHPAYEGRPDGETVPLIPALAVLNRAGYVTEQSQPGLIDGTLRQRAFVCGWADREHALDLEERLTPTNLIVTARPPGRFPENNILTVTLDDGEQETWAGGAESSDESAEVFAYGDLCTLEACEALRQAWRWSVIDPTWGRNRVLWPMLCDLVGAPNTALNLEP